MTKKKSKKFAKIFENCFRLLVSIYESKEIQNIIAVWPYKMLSILFLFFLSVCIRITLRNSNKFLYFYQGHGVGEVQVASTSTNFGLKRIEASSIGLVWWAVKWC